MAIIDPQRLLRVTAVSGDLVTPDDDNDLTTPAQAGLLVATAGDVSFIDGLGNQVDLEDLTVGYRIPLVATRVLETTTATVYALN